MKRIINAGDVEGRTIRAFQAGQGGNFLVFSDDTYLALSSDSPITTDATLDNDLLVKLGIMTPEEKAATEDQIALAATKPNYELYLALKAVFEPNSVALPARK